MKTFYQYFAVVALMLGASFQCFAVHDLTIAYDQAQASDNYYVQPGGVYIAPNGIYASIDGNLIQIYTLCSDTRGVFVPYEEIIAGDLEYCPFCQSWYNPKDDHNCPGPRD